MHACIVEATPGGRGERPHGPLPLAPGPAHHRAGPARVRDAGRRAALPGRRHRHRRSAGDAAAGRAGPGGVGAPVRHLAVQLPRLRHDAAGWRVPGAPTTRASAAGVGVQSLWLGILLGLPLAAALALFARPVVQLLGGHGAALEAAVTYLRISALGVPFVLLALVGAGVFRGVADLRTPLAIVLDGERRQPAPRDRRGVRARPRDRRIGLEHGRRPDRRRRRVPAAHAPPPRRPRRPAGPIGPSWPAWPGRAATSCCGSSRSSPRSPSPPRSRPASTRPPSPRTRSSTPCSPCSCCRWTPSPSRRRPWWPRRSAPATRGWPEGWGSGCSCCRSWSAAGSRSCWPRSRRSWRGCSAATRRSPAGRRPAWWCWRVLLLPGSVAFALDGVLIGAGDVRFLGRAMVIALGDLRALRRPAAAAPLARDRRGVGGAGDLDDGPGGADAPALPGHGLDQLITSPGRSTPGGGAAPCRWWCRRRGRGGRSCRAAG